MSFDIDIEKDFSGGRTVGIYVPVGPEFHDYGVTPRWNLWCQAFAWSTDQATDSYDSVSGTGYTQSRSVYIGASGRSNHNNDLLPPRVGIQFGEKHNTIFPSLSVENLNDADGKYEFSLVFVSK